MGRIKNDSLFRLMHDYLKIYLPDQKCASSNTIIACRTALNQLLDYAVIKTEKSLSEISFELLDSEMVLDYLDWLTCQKGYSAKTRNQRLACIRGFFSYAAAREPDNIIFMTSLAKIPLQKSISDKRVEYLTETALKTLLQQPDTTNRKGIRDQFFMILMYDTGARIDEMIRLKICDIRLGKTPTATLLGKGSKLRTVPLMPETISHYHRYMELYHYGENNFSSKNLFYICQHNNIHPMSDDNVRRFLNTYAKAARKKCSEVPERVYPHLFRHSRAMHLYQHGMDLTMVSQWLGHVNLSTTLVYAYADTEQKRIAIEKANGRGNFSSVKSLYTESDEDILRRLYGLK